MVVFDGIVRDNTRGRKTLYLDYEAYEEMALKQMNELARLIEQRRLRQGMVTLDLPEVDHGSPAGPHRYWRD